MIRAKAITEIRRLVSQLTSKSAYFVFLRLSLPFIRVSYESISYF
jgi:hypothetical protein